MLRRIILCFTLLAVLSGCGFKLRGLEPMPDNIKQVYVVSQVKHAPMYRQLLDRLDHFQIQRATSFNQQDPQDTVAIYLFPEEVERRLLSVFATGQVAEYELIYTSRYEIQFPNQDPQLVEFDVLRDYQDDPDQVLAKSRELELVLSEMRTEAADRIIRLLASQANTGN